MLQICQLLYEELKIVIEKKLGNFKKNMSGHFYYKSTHILVQSHIFYCVFYSSPPNKCLSFGSFSIRINSLSTNSTISCLICR